MQTKFTCEQLELLTTHVVTDFWKKYIKIGTTNYKNGNYIGNTNNIGNTKQTKKEDITWRFGNMAIKTA